MTLRDVGGMVYFLFALVLFATLTNITAMDNDGRMPSLPSMDPGAAVEVGSAATVRPVMFSGLLAATRAAAEISAEYVSQLAREALVENGLNAASLPATTLSSIAAAAAVAAAGIRRNFPGSIPASFSLLKVPLLDSWIAGFPGRWPGPSTASTVGTLRGRSHFRAATTLLTNLICFVDR